MTKCERFTRIESYEEGRGGAGIMFEPMKVDGESPLPSCQAWDEFSRRCVHEGGNHYIVPAGGLPPIRINKWKLRWASMRRRVKRLVRRPIRHKRIVYDLLKIPEMDSMRAYEDWRRQKDGKVNNGNTD